MKNASSFVLSRSADAADVCVLRDWGYKSSIQRVVFGWYPPTPQPYNRCRKNRKNLSKNRTSCSLSSQRVALFDCPGPCVPTGQKDTCRTRADGTRSEREIRIRDLKSQQHIHTLHIPNAKEKILHIEKHAAPSHIAY